MIFRYKNVMQKTTMHVMLSNIQKPKCRTFFYFADGSSQFMNSDDPEYIKDSFIPNKSSTNFNQASIINYPLVN